MVTHILYSYKDIDCKEIAKLLYIHISTVYAQYNEYGTVVPVIHRSEPIPLLGKAAEEYSVIETLMAKPEI